MRNAMRDGRDARDPALIWAGTIAGADDIEMKPW